MHITHSHRKYLRLIYQDRTYELQYLPFGLSSAPRAFTKTATEAITGSVVVHGYPGCDLHRRHVISPPTEQGAAENLWSSGRPTGKAGLSSEKGEVLSYSLPTSYLFRSCPRLNNNDPVPPSTKLTTIVDTCHHFLCSRVRLSEDSVHVDWTNEKQGSWLHHFITEVFNAYACMQCRIMGRQGK